MQILQELDYLDQIVIGIDRANQQEYVLDFLSYLNELRFYGMMDHDYVR